MFERHLSRDENCSEVETVRRSTYPGDRVSAGGECEAVVTVRTR